MDTLRSTVVATCNTATCFSHRTARNQSPQASRAQRSHTRQAQRDIQQSGHVGKPLRPVFLGSPLRSSSSLCRAVVDSEKDTSLTVPSTFKPETKTEAPSCCGGKNSDDVSAGTSVASSRVEDSSSPSSTVLNQSNPLLPAGILGAGLAVAFLALHPSLLPFDIDDVQDWLDEGVFYASQEINRAVNSQLGQDAAGPLAPGLLGLVFGAGLITSFAPCTLSVLPLTIGYIAGFNTGNEGEGGEGTQKQRSSVAVNALFFSLGLASTFSTLGITAALAGKAYGQMGPGLPIAVSAITMYMGLNMLGLVRFQPPSLFANFDAKEAAASLPVSVQMYLGGLTFALLASPCSTPVLASLLGYVASSEDVLVGFALLLAYTFGRVMPVLVAASFTGSMKQMLLFRQYSKWVNPASGALLLGIGTFSMLSRVFPASTGMALAVGMGSM